MFELKKVKLIIWDMDDTFWNGTLSEGFVEIIPDHVQLIKDLTDAGIVNSICSKNDFAMVERKLSEIQLWQYFVFPQISWNPKGEIVRDTIREMNLRAENVLFIDDNPSNRNEVQFYSPEIMVCEPEEIGNLIESCTKLEKSDVQHKRLTQYHVLERKAKERKQVVNNEDFLRNSCIQICIEHDCMENVDRIHDMIMRTNQLNYTKKRIDKEKLVKILQDKRYECGYVRVDDRFGDYGISGFYAVKDGCLEHFLFSCRVMGMGIEQYIYSKLGWPELEVIGTVTYEVGKYQAPDWINQQKLIENPAFPQERVEIKYPPILIKGPCDMEQILAYIKKNDQLVSELTYINPETGVSIESYNHTHHIVQAKTVSEERQRLIISELPFSSPEFFSKKIYEGKNQIVFFSLFTDPNLGLYRRKETGEVIAFGEYCYDLTDSDNWQGYIDGSIFNANCVFSEKSLRSFSDKYTYIGRIKPEEIVNNLDFIRENMPESTLLVLILGVEFPFSEKERKSCWDRHIFNKEMNKLIREFAQVRDNVEVLEFSKYVKTPDDMYNNINHFVKPVYYNMAQDVIEIINRYSGNNQLERRSWLYMQKTNFQQRTLFIQDTAIYQWCLAVKHSVERIFKSKP